MENLEGSGIVFQLLLAVLISAVSFIGSNLIDVTSLSFTNVFTTLFSLCLHTCAGILSTSVVPSLYVHSIMIGMTSPPLLLKLSSYIFLLAYFAFSLGSSPSAALAGTVTVILLVS